MLAVVRAWRRWVLQLAMKTVRFGGQDIAWLLAVPVSKAETEYAQRFGPEKLEKLFEQKNVDIFDLNRRSVV